MSTTFAEEEISLHEKHKILCCLCGTAIPPNPANMCANCIRSQVDITSDINKQEMITFCSYCERYLQPPKYWLACQPESKELLTLCLKKIKALNKLKLIDASFIWTEPHSKRIKVKITIQKEVFNGTKIQQSCVIEYVIKHSQCEMCAREFTPHKWVAVVQLRQKVPHKRTFYFLEQLILKHKAQKDCINIKDRPDGLDFYFNHKSHANKFLEFVNSVAPLKTRTSEQLISHDVRNNTYYFKYTFSAEIAPICREDLICLPKQFYKSLGGIGPLVICTHVNSALHFIDPITLNVAEIPGSLYWKNPFPPLATSRQLTEFEVLDVEKLRGKEAKQRGKFALAEAQICRSEHIGEDNSEIFVTTHLGNLLHPGDTVKGYDIQSSNFNDKNLRSYKSMKLPDVILVRKVFEKRRNRNWKLKQIEKEVEDNGKKKAQTKDEKDYKRFLEELEEDEELRAKIDIYKDKKNNDKSETLSLNDDEGVVPGISDDELIDDDTSDDTEDKTEQNVKSDPTQKNETKIEEETTL